MSKPTPVNAHPTSIDPLPLALSRVHNEIVLLPVLIDGTSCPVPIPARQLEELASLNEDLISSMASQVRDRETFGANEELIKAAIATSRMLNKLIRLHVALHRAAVLLVPNWKMDEPNYFRLKLAVCKVTGLQPNIYDGFNEADSVRTVLHATVFKREQKSELVEIVQAAISQHAITGLLQSLV